MAIQKKIFETASKLLTSPSSGIVNGIKTLFEEDRSTLGQRMVDASEQPYFIPPETEGEPTEQQDNPGNPGNPGMFV